MAERRGSALAGELNRAQAKIGTLEDFIRDRERQFHVAVSRLHGAGERRSSRLLRHRRAGITHDTVMRLRTMSQESLEEDLDAYSQSLGEYACLKLVRIQDDPNSDDPIPFLLRRLVGRQYHVGPEGVCIGTSHDCNVCVPRESEVWGRHVEIRWNPGTFTLGHSVAMVTRRGSRLSRQTPVEDQGWFELCDLTEGRGPLQILQAPTPTETSHAGLPVIQIDTDPLNDASTLDSEPPQLGLSQSDDGTVPTGGNTSTNNHQSPSHTKLTHGIQFQTGCLVWGLTALPQSQVLTLKMFRAAQDGNLDNLQRIIDSSQCGVHTQPYVFVTPLGSGHTHRRSSYRYSTVSIVSDSGIDVNTEYEPPLFSDDTQLTHPAGRRRSSAVPSHSPTHSFPLSPTLPPQLGPRLLLHIAVQNNDLAMVQYLLEKGGNVNLTSGELAQTSLHIASRLSLPDILQELLRNGGDVEIRDIHHRTPLEVASHYEIRKLLLNSVLLCAAAEAGDMEEVLRLLTAGGVSPNVCGLQHKTALHLAAAQGHAPVVEVLVANGANVDARGGSQMRTPLHYASLKNHVAIATMLLSAGANEFARDSSGYTALNLSMGGDMCKLLHKQPLSLCLAAQSGDVDSVRELLKENEDQLQSAEGAENLVDQRNEQSHAPLHIACTTGNIELAQLLTSHGANVNLHGGRDAWTPLFYAAMSGHAALVEFLLSVGASTEEVDCHGNTVKMRVESAMEEIQERLNQLEKGRSENQTHSALHTLQSIPMTRQESSTSYSKEIEQLWLSHRYDQLREVSAVLTPAHERMLKAIDTHNMADFLHLLESGAVSPDVMVDRHYPTPALTRTAEQGLFQFTEELLKRGAQASPSGSQDQVPLLVAASNGHTDILQLLIAHGANINIQSTDTQTTALHEAAGSNCLEAVQFLLSQGADRTALNCNGETPFDCTTVLEIRQLLAVGADCLFVAACTGDIQTIRCLITEEGVSPSHEFQQGVTALHEACEGGFEECASVLIELGAEVNKQTHTTQTTPLHIASRYNHVAIAKHLLKGGAKLDLKDSDGKVPFEVACTNQMRKILIEARSVRPVPVPYQREGSKEKLCKICMDNAINTIILPCGHQAFCTSCVSRISTCALDRQPIREVITVFK